MNLRERAYNLALSFALDAGYTAPAIGDRVVITGNTSGVTPGGATVALAGVGATNVVGKVVSIDQAPQTGGTGSYSPDAVTVMTNGYTCEDMVASAAITAGQLVVMAASGQVAAYTAWNALSDIALNFTADHIALSTANTYTDAAVNNAVNTALDAIATAINTAVNAMTLTGGNDPSAVVGIALNTTTAAGQTVSVLLFR